MVHTAAALLYLIVSTVSVHAQSQQLGQQCYDLHTQVLGRSGDKFGSGTFGVLFDAKRQPIVQLLDKTGSAFRKSLTEGQLASRANGRFTKDAQLADVYSSNPDFPSFQEVGGKTFMINHFEAPLPSTAYVSELAADSDGKLRIVSTSPVDDTSPDVQGLWFMCHGEKTPWGTHIGGEEYPPDCHEYEQVFLPCTDAAGYCGYNESWSGQGVLQFARYYGYFPGAEEQGQEGAALTGNDLKDFKEKFSCYNYGASPEISVQSASGNTLVTKWRTLGRISHETAVVMPDKRTVYSTDDGSNGVLVMFKADTPGDLSSGALFAARFKSKGGNTFDVDWVKLGRGTQAELQALAINPATKFSDMFETAEVGGDGKCPTGFLPANPPSSYYQTKVNGRNIRLQCLKIKAGQEAAAAFLETQRVAAVKGATTEFEKLEGFTFDPSTRTAYMALTRVDKASLKGHPYDGLGPDHLQLEANPCGVILELKMDPNWQATSARVLLAGNTKTNTDALNKCDVNAIAGPDNLFYTIGNLLIAEDTSLHYNNVLWAYNLKTGSLSCILSSPTGAEVSGPSVQWSGGRAYITWTMQHPMDWEGTRQPRDAAEEAAMRGYVGYLGPLTAAATAGTLDFAPGAIKAPESAGDRLRILAASKVCKQE